MDRSRNLNSSKVPPMNKNKPPQIRQTLASKYRLLKANPLLRLELEKKLAANNPNPDSNENPYLFMTPLKTLAKVLDNEEPQFTSVKLRQTQQTTKKIVSDNLNVRKTNKTAVTAHPIPQKTVSVLPGSVKPSQTQQTTKKTVSEHFNIRKTNQTSVTAHQIQQKTVSVLSANVGPSQTQQTTKKPVSDKVNVRKTNQTAVTAHPMQEKTVPENKPKILNPKNALNKSKFLEHSQISLAKDIKNVNNPYRNVTCIRDQKNWSLTPHRASKEITRRLSEWMKTRGRNIADYHHLKCFGIHLQNEKSNNVADKENIETRIVRNNSFTNLTEEEVVKNEENNLDFSTVARDALLDLHKLILEGYPPEQCEIWLKLINEKSEKLIEEPDFWECRAALEQSKGNVNLAVECYKAAIIQGAEVQAVDKHLDQLLQKFSLLNISKEVETKNTERNKVAEDARNIFKSSIIQFAVQERIIRTRNNDAVSFEKKLIATPVRRSTRRSRSAFTTTPKVQIYSSLQEIDSSIRRTLDFKCNNALRD